MSDLTPGTDPIEFQRKLQLLYGDIASKIERYGWTMIASVTAEGIPFAYTVGLTLKRHPEIVISGLPMGSMSSILGEAAEKVVKGDCLEVGRPYNDIVRSTEGNAEMSVTFREASTKFCIIARRLFSTPGIEVSAIQLLWPDRAGRPYGDPAFDPDLATAQIEL